MRPILLSGHERSLTQIKYNAEGDLLFSASKDHIINVWHSHNGERLGTYDGHNGTVWSIDVDATSTYLISGSADNMMKLWLVRTGECLKTWEFTTAVKRVAWSEDGSKILAVTEQRMGYQGAVRIFEINRAGGAQSTEPLFTIEPPSRLSKATVAIWTALDQFIVTGHENGKINLWDMEGELFEEKEDKAHMEPITDMQRSQDGTYFVSSSKDKTAKIWSVGPDKTANGTDYLTLIKTFAGETPLNSAAIIPNKPYIICGGGQEAMAVTTTSARQGGFEIRFWHRVFEEEVARVKGGFGPCNTIAVHPQSKGYSIGGEDGYVRVHHFDEDFFTARPYGNLEAED